MKDKEMLMGIYEIQNTVTETYYVGSSINFKKRLSTHRNQLNKNKHINMSLQRDWNKYGEENFKFEIVKEVSDEKELAKEEFLHIQHRKNHSKVYNISDPMEEAISGRFDKKDKNVKKKKKLKVHKYKTKKDAIEYLDEHFKDKIIILRESVEERVFYHKEQVDEWFLNNIKDNDFLEDERVIIFLNAWYNKYGFCIIDPRMYKSIIYKLYNKNCGSDGFILVTQATNALLYDTKFNRKRVY